MTNDDNSIIERIRGGETSEFAQLVKRYGPSLMVFVGRIVGVQEDTETWCRTLSSRPINT